MKRSFSFFIIQCFFSVFLFSCNEESKEAPKDTFTVSGTIKGLDSEFMSRSYKDKDDNWMRDTIWVENESFNYTAKINEPTHIIFWPNIERTMKRSGGGYYPVKSGQFAFLASPGDEIVFSGEITDFVNAYPSGTKANDELAQINREIFPMMNESINLRLKINELGEGDEIGKGLFEKAISELDSLVLQAKKEFVESNPASQAAAWYLSDFMLRSQFPQEDAITMFNGLDSSLSGYTFYDEVAQRVAGIESTKEGKIMPNFSTDATVNGETFVLNDLRGKYVLIDFWGTWCAPCIAEMPTVKEYQEKYADKLVVVGVNNGDTIEKIKNFTEPKGYDWLQIKDKNGVEDLVLKLNVAGFPTKFILSPEGEILHRFVGNTEVAFEALDKLFGE